MGVTEPNGFDTDDLTGSPRSTMSVRAAVSVVIPTYNMGWCVSRAVSSCQSQSHAPDEIIIVDDASTDDTEQVVQQLAAREARIKYFKQHKNGGHLAALKCGIQNVKSDWAVLLDADDELTPASIACRVEAAITYAEAKGERPQLIYGDLASGDEFHEVNRFPRLEGRAYQFLSRELSLCQTSTMMIGRDAFSQFPATNNPWNTDDEIALAIGRDFPILHSRQVVAIYHMHGSSTKMGNNPKRRFAGVCQLVRDHKAEILEFHGHKGLLLWRLRIARAFLAYQTALAGQYLGTESIGMRRLAHINDTNTNRRPVSARILRVIVFLSASSQS
jgi:glycosyltransferase involved in cell wall biosynthesis